MPIDKVNLFVPPPPSTVLNNYFSFLAPPFDIIMMNKKNVCYCVISIIMIID